MPRTIEEIKQKISFVVSHYGVEIIGKTEKALAEEAGVSLECVNYLIRWYGKAPSIDDALKVIGVLKVSPEFRLLVRHLVIESLSSVTPKVDLPTRLIRDLPRSRRSTEMSS